MSKTLKIAEQVVKENLDKTLEETAQILMLHPELKHPGFTIAQARKIVFRVMDKMILEVTNG